MFIVFLCLASPNCPWLPTADPSAVVIPLSACPLFSSLFWIRVLVQKRRGRGMAATRQTRTPLRLKLFFQFSILWGRISLHNTWGSHRTSALGIPISPTPVSPTPVLPTPISPTLISPTLKFYLIPVSPTIDFCACVWCSYGKTCSDLHYCMTVSYDGKIFNLLLME